MSLDPCSIPAVRNLSLNAANCPDGIYVHANGAQARIYEALLADNLIEELDCFHPSVRCFCATQLGKLQSDAIAPDLKVPNDSFASQAFYAN